MTKQQEMNKYTPVTLFICTLTVSKMTIVDYLSVSIMEWLLAWLDHEAAAVPCLIDFMHKLP